MAINLVGCDENIVMPVNIQFQGGKSVKFKVEFQRMTRSDARKIRKEAFARNRELAKLSTRLAEASSLEARLEIEEDESEIKSITAKLKGDFNIDKLDKKIADLNKMSDDDLRSRIKGWTGLHDADKKKVEFADDVLDMMINNAVYFKALDEAQWAATGEMEKN